MQHDAPGQYEGDEPGFDEPAGPPYRAIAMVLLAAVVLAIGVGLVQLFGGDDGDPVAEETGTAQVENGTGADPDDSGPAEGAPAEGGPADEGDAPAPGEQGEGQPPAEDGQPAEGPRPGESADGQESPAPGGADVPDVTSVPVQVFNNSNITGLAGRTGEELRENGFAVGDVANLPSNRGVVPETTVYFGNAPGEQQAAEAVAAQLGARVEPRPGDLAPGADGVIVIVTQDLDR